MLNNLLRVSLQSFLACTLMAASTAMAEEVSVNGVHLCCGSCVKAATKALSHVEGVSQVRVNKDEETVTFNATDEAAGKRGLTALADTGFYGTSSVPGPDLGIDPELNANEVHISKIHLCCPGCTKAVDAALKNVNGVKSVDVSQSKAGKITVKGEKINLAATLKALHEAGFHGTVKE